MPSEPLPPGGAFLNDSLERSRRRLHRFVRSRLRVRPEEAEDVVQESLLRVLSAADAGAALPPAALLRGVARNVARERRREKRVLLLCDLGQCGEAWDKVRSMDAGLDRQAERSEERRAVVRAVSRARTEHADVLVLRFWRGLGVREIATRRGRSEEATRSLLRRALPALRRVLGELRIDSVPVIDTPHEVPSVSATVARRKDQGGGRRARRGGRLIQP